MKYVPYQFSVGFELEMAVSHTILTGQGGMLQKRFGELLASAGTQVTGGTDGSIEYTGNCALPVEIRTEKMRWKPGCENFEQLLCALYPLSESGLMVTNDSCGLHVNISEATITGGKELDDFHTHILEIFPENKVLSMFERRGNTYCAPYLDEDGNKSTTVIRRSKREGDTEKDGQKKYRAVANRGHGRIEFRCLGGKNYHIRWSVLQEALKLIREAIVYGYTETKKEHAT